MGALKAPNNFVKTAKSRPVDVLDDEVDVKSEAQKAGREMARKRRVEHIIKKKDGTIGERNSYGNDPRNVPG